MKKLKTIFLLTCVATLVSACSGKKQTAQVGYISTKSLSEKANAVGIGSIRLQGLRQTASSIGSRGGLAWRSEHIDKALKQQETYLDHVFNFNQMLLPHNVLPPILSYTDKSLNLSSDDTIRLADKTYTIILPARFVSAPPTWRDYLWMSFKKPSVPSATLLPHSQREVKYWNTYLKRGWKRGLQQANQIFAVNLARLKRDMSGMILYKKLLAEHMVSQPFVSRTDLGITGDTSSLRINDHVLRIAAQSELQTNSKRWKPVLTKEGQ